MRVSPVVRLVLLLPFGLASAIPITVEARDSCVPASAAALKNVKDKFTSSGVVPTLIPSIDPTLLLTAVYGAKKVDLGNSFKTPETLSVPSVSITKENGSSSDTTYSLFMINPDNPAPNPPAGVRSPFLHWQLSGLKPACIGSTTGPQTTAFYIPLFPPSIDQARYTFLIYREPSNYIPQVLTPTLRAQFDPNAYAAQGRLTLVGGNFLREGQINNIPAV